MNTAAYENCRIQKLLVWNNKYWKESILYFCLAYTKNY